MKKVKPVQLITAALIAAATMLGGCSSVPSNFRTASCADYACVEKTVSSLALQEMKRNKVNGLSIAIVDDKGLIWSDGFLVVEYFAPLVADERIGFPISPISESEAVILGIGNGMGETIRTVNDNGNEFLEYSGYRFRKINE